MITYFMQLNVKLLFVLILFGFIMGQTRHAAIQNFSNKNRSYLILDFFNLVGTPVHEIGLCSLDLYLDIRLIKSAFIALPKRHCIPEALLVL